MTPLIHKEKDVIIIGGGATGSGILRDCARRGLSCVLFERKDISTGATGRNHGLLHSGARYAVTDGESARECIEENIILKRIAHHCIEQTNGLFISLPEDDLAYQHTLIKACHKAGISATAIDPKEALFMEPSVNPAITGAVLVPDGSIDPFQLTVSNILDAKRHGAECFTYHEVTKILKEGDDVVGVEVYDHCIGKNSIIKASIVINAGGIWGQHIAEMAGVSVQMFPTRGSLLILGHRINNMVLNRCRKPANADILVPGDTVSLIGTTSYPIPFEDIDSQRVTSDEVDLLIEEGAKLAPSLLSTRKLRAYTGSRPLVADDSDPSGRTISRKIVLLDHEERDGVKGFITISGGKLITYRLMAEIATDLACKKLGNTNLCDTAHALLPGSLEKPEKTLLKIVSLPKQTQSALISRHGNEASVFSTNKSLENSLVCECESVTVGEVKYAVESLAAHTLTDLRRRTRLGMGTCQGELCACRAAGLLTHYKACVPHQVQKQIANFMEERWKGVSSLAWGDSLRESEFTMWLYKSVCGLRGEDFEEKNSSINKELLERTSSLPDLSEGREE